MTYSMKESAKESVIEAPAQRVGRLLTFPATASAGMSGSRNMEGRHLLFPLPRRALAMSSDSDKGMMPELSIQGNASPVLEALRGCRDRLRSAAGAAVAVHVSAESGLPALALDNCSLEQVLLQLVKNAAEAMPEGGSVHIVARRALSRSNPAVLVHVSDDGHGIPAYALEHIFKPGFSSKRDMRGWSEHCGLGLAIVRDLVQGVGGAVEVASTRRRGTTFELRIPCVSQPIR